MGRPEIQKFVGALHGKNARKGIFITTSNFTKEASGYVKGLQDKVVLIDGDTLANLIIDHTAWVWRLRKPTRSSGWTRITSTKPSLLHT